MDEFYESSSYFQNPQYLSHYQPQHQQYYDQQLYYEMGARQGLAFLMNSSSSEFDDAIRFEQGVEEKMDVDSTTPSTPPPSSSSPHRYHLANGPPPSLLNSTFDQPLARAIVTWDPVTRQQEFLPLPPSSSSSPITPTSATLYTTSSSSAPTWDSAPPSSSPWSSPTSPITPSSPLDQIDEYWREEWNEVRDSLSPSNFAKITTLDRDGNVVNDDEEREDDRIEHTKFLEKVLEDLEGLEGMRDGGRGGVPNALLQIVQASVKDERNFEDDVSKQFWFENYDPTSSVSQLHQPPQHLPLLHASTTSSPPPPRIEDTPNFDEFDFSNISAKEEESNYQSRFSDVDTSSPEYASWYHRQRFDRALDAQRLREEKERTYRALEESSLSRFRKDRTQTSEGKSSNNIEDEDVYHSGQWLPPLSPSSPLPLVYAKPSSSSSSPIIDVKRVPKSSSSTKTDIKRSPKLLSTTFHAPSRPLSTIPEEPILPVIITRSQQKRPPPRASALVSQRQSQQDVLMESSDDDSDSETNSSESPSSPITSVGRPVTRRFATSSVRDEGYTKKPAGGGKRGSPKLKGRGRNVGDNVRVEKAKVGLLVVWDRVDKKCLEPWKGGEDEKNPQGDAKRYQSVLFAKEEYVRVWKGKEEVFPWSGTGQWFRGQIQTTHCKCGFKFITTRSGELKNPTAVRDHLIKCASSQAQGKGSSSALKYFAEIWRDAVGQQTSKRSTTTKLRPTLLA